MVTTVIVNIILKTRKACSCSRNRTLRFVVVVRVYKEKHQLRVTWPEPRTQV